MQNFLHIFPPQLYILQISDAKDCNVQRYSYICRCVSHDSYPFLYAIHLSSSSSLCTVSDLWYLLAPSMRHMGHTLRTAPLTLSWKAFVWHCHSYLVRFTYHHILWFICHHFLLHQGIYYFTHFPLEFANDCPHYYNFW